jgi:hypothetical protein
MGTASTQRTAKAINWTNSGSQAGEIASLRAAIASGQTIYANDLNRIGTLINNMNGHYHTYDDAYQLATYGNNGDRNNYYEDKNTNSIDQVVTAPTDTASNTTITASRHNELQYALNVLAYHVHGIDDRTG